MNYKAVAQHAALPLVALEANNRAISGLGFLFLRSRKVMSPTDRVGTFAVSPRRTSAIA